MSRQKTGNSKLGRHHFFFTYAFKMASHMKECETKKPFFSVNGLSELLIVYYFGFQSHDASLSGNQSQIIPVTVYCSSVCCDTINEMMNVCKFLEDVNAKHQDRL